MTVAASICVASALAILLTGWLIARIRLVRAAFSRETLEALARAMPAMRKTALEKGTGVFHSPALLVVYSVRRDVAGWVHHLSAASSASKASSVGTFFLGIAQTAFHLEGPKPELFVTPRRVFHFEVVLSDEAHATAIEKPIDLADTRALREAGRHGQETLIHRVVARNVPLPPLDSAR